MIRYNNLSAFLRKKFESSIGKICIDGGFTCPNRDGKCGVGGCVFCGERGAGENINPRDTIYDHVRKLLSEKDNRSTKKYVAYFQNFTNTYAEPKVLKERYDAALDADKDGKIIALCVSTRPDCITDEIARLLSGYKNRCYVWAEVGLQTSNDKTLKRINRNHTAEDFTKAVKILNSYGIDVVAHMMIGLPEETFEDVKNTVDFLNHHNIQGLKIHGVYVMRNTVLAKMYKRGDYTCLSIDDYVKQTVYVITHISPDLIIHRLAGSCTKRLLIAPEWSADKNKVIRQINKMLDDKDLYQGVFYKPIKKNIL